MGKESRIKSQKTTDGSTRYQYSNGDRKLYDRDAPPQGADELVWHLALYFEQRAEKYGWVVQARPILYTELYHRVSNDADLSVLLSVGSNYAYCGIPVVEVIEAMIDNYYSNYSSNSSPSINDFCNKVTFDYYKDYVTEIIQRNNLITTGTRNAQVERPVQPPRRTEEESEEAKIKFGRRDLTDEDYKRKFSQWREEHK